MVIDRHLASGAVGRGFIRGLGLQAGAFGNSFNPGISDVAVVGMDDRDMAVVANRIVELGGGYVVARDGRVLAEMPLPLWGILSDERYEVAVAQQEAVHRALREELGSPLRGIHTGMGFFCLTIIIPSLKICAKGLVEVDRDAQEAVELFA